MSTELQPYQCAIVDAREKFLRQANDVRVYDRESIFAMQAVMKTNYALSIANNNPGSVRLAMINVAATGLTLNPANAYAYLVPRDNAIVLDISYKGLIKIATDSGSIMWARADVVYSSDTFTYHGPAKIPDHVADPFKKDRGEVVGVYCIAKTKDGDILTEVMSLAELEKVRGKSTAYVKYHKTEPSKAGPWVEFFDQMAKKAVIKRASKTWPYTDERLAQAIEIANTSEGGYDLSSEEEREAQHQLQHEAACGRHWKTIAYINQVFDEIEQEAQYTGNREDAEAKGGAKIAEAWYELEQDQQRLLWRAPTKGGIPFTTAQRDFIKNKLPRTKPDPEEHKEAA